MGIALAWLCCFGVVLFIDWPHMRHNQHRYDSWIFAGLLFLAVLYGYLYEAGVRLPDPQGLVKMVFEPIGEQLMRPSHAN